jgi:hypothetical protein
MTVKFGELPAVTEVRATSTRWEQVAKDLRSKPGLWACVRVCGSGPAASAMAQAIKRGRIVAFRTGGHEEPCVMVTHLPVHDPGRVVGVGRFEAVSRGCETWARFVVSCSVVDEQVTES